MAVCSGSIQFRKFIAVISEAECLAVEPQLRPLESAVADCLEAKQGCDGAF